MELLTVDIASRNSAVTICALERPEALPNGAGNGIQVQQYTVDIR